MFKRNFLAGSAMALLSAGVLAGTRSRDHHMGHTRYPTGHGRSGRTYFQHPTGATECARRRYQMQRDETRQRERGDAHMGPIEYDRISRRGRVIV